MVVARRRYSGIDRQYDHDIHLPQVSRHSRCIPSCVPRPWERNVSRVASCPVFSGNPLVWVEGSSATRGLSAELWRLFRIECIGERLFLSLLELAERHGQFRRARR